MSSQSPGYILVLCFFSKPGVVLKYLHVFYPPFSRCGNVVLTFLIRFSHKNVFLVQTSHFCLNSTSSQQTRHLICRAHLEQTLQTQHSPLKQTQCDSSKEKRLF